MIGFKYGYLIANLFFLGVWLFIFWRVKKIAKVNAHHEPDRLFFLVLFQSFGTLLIIGNRKLLFPWQSAELRICYLASLLAGLALLRTSRFLYGVFANAKSGFILTS